MRPIKPMAYAQAFIARPYEAANGDRANGEHLETLARCRESLVSARYGGDVERLAAIRGDDALARQLQRTEVLRRNSSIRTRLLAQAVRVRTSLIPHVARALSRVARVLSIDEPLEVHVFTEPTVHAFVHEAGSRYLVGLSSGAVHMLGTKELEFVIGHELGHAAFGHLDVVAEAGTEPGAMCPQQTMVLRAWQRAAEISADRVGLLCCSSPEIAATALFKILCGLDLPGIALDPAELARQWDGLAEEVLEQVARDSWKMPHPFPHLRMQALLLFWSRRGPPEVDRAVARLLAPMDSHDIGSDAVHRLVNE
jgi:hypothetical protein